MDEGLDQAGGGKPGVGAAAGEEGGDGGLEPVDQERRLGGIALGLQRLGRRQHMTAAGDVASEVRERARQLGGRDGGELAAEDAQVGRGRRGHGGLAGGLAGERLRAEKVSTWKRGRRRAQSMADAPCYGLSVTLGWCK